MLTTSEILLEAFCNAVGDLVECYGGAKPQTTPTSNSTEKHDITAIIGMCDESLSASIALTTDEDTVRALSRFPLTNLADWLGELSNQLAGRYKNKLAIYGLLPRLSTPTTVTGKQLQLGALAGEVHVFAVQWPGGCFEAQLSLELEGTLELREDHALASAEEGSLSLF